MFLMSEVNLKALRAEVDRLYAIALEAQRKAQAVLRRYRKAMVEQYGVPPDASCECKKAKTDSSSAEE